MHFSSEEYASRHRALAALMQSNSAFILVAPPQRQRSHDTYYRYRASSDILYLCGFEEPGAVLVYRPEAQERVVLFVQPKDQKKEQWDGYRAGPQGAVANYPVDAAYNIDELEELLPGMLEEVETMYFTLGSKEEFESTLMKTIRGLRTRRGKPAGGPSAIRDAHNLVHTLRLKKSEEEVGVIRRSCEISASAHTLAMKAAGHVTFEYELQALIEYEFARQGASYPAYATIVGGGANATILHYTTNQEKLHKEDLVLVDAGCEWGGYASDITRTWPVGGKFEGAARDLYQAVLGIQAKLLDAIKPGETFVGIAKLCRDETIKALMDLEVLETTSLEEQVERGDYKRFMPHGFGHWLGSDVHDVGGYFDHEGPRAMEEGFVVTVEPGIYFLANDEKAPEAFRGLGVRIEDDALLKEGGCENLTIACPKEIDDLEAIIGSGVTLKLQ